jgi:ParB family chromosome partitioning protein
MTNQPKRLGRGLSSLISTDFSREKLDSAAPPPQTIDTAAPQSPAAPVASRPTLLTLKLSEIRQNPLQPRKHFDEAALHGLAQSLRERGALQPIVVRRAEVGYELVAGERRFRASKLADLNEITAIVRNVSDEEMLELALIENIQRADLNPLERARGYLLLHDKYGLTHEEIAAKMGEDRASVTNFMRLLQLSEPVLELIGANLLGLGHARALVAIKDTAQQIKLADKICKEGWSVRKTETIIAGLHRGGGGGATVSLARKPNVEDLEQRLGASLGTRVTIREGRRRHSGRLVIEYYTLDDFERITQRLGLSGD